MDIVGWIALVAAIFTCFQVFEKTFEDMESRVWMGEHLQKYSWGKGYRGLLREGLKWLENKIDGELLPSKDADWRTQGKYFLRSRVFIWWLPFSFFYPIVLLLLEWVLSGQSGLVSGLPNLSTGVRHLIALVYSVLIGLSFYSLKSRQFVRVIVAGAFVGAFAVAGAFVGAFAVAGAVAAAGTFAGTAAIAFTFAFAGTAAIAFAFTFAKVHLLSLYYIFFLLILPYLNCVFDYLSWGASRWLLHRIANKENSILIFGYGILDLFFAALCLMALAFFLPLSIQFFISLLESTSIDLRGYLELMIQDPLGKGLGITGMLFTTFIPTAIHLGIALFALCLPIFMWEENTAKRLFLEPEDTLSTVVDRARVLGITLIPPVIFFTLCYTTYNNIQWVRDVVLGGVGWFGGVLYFTAMTAIGLVG